MICHSLLLLSAVHRACYMVIRDLIETAMDSCYELQLRSLPGWTRDARSDHLTSASSLSLLVLFRVFWSTH